MVVFRIAAPCNVLIGCMPLFRRNLLPPSSENGLWHGVIFWLYTSVSEEPLSKRLILFTSVIVLGVLNISSDVNACAFWLALVSETNIRKWKRKRGGERWFHDKSNNAKKFLQLSFLFILQRGFMEQRKKILRLFERDHAVPSSQTAYFSWVIISLTCVAEVHVLKWRQQRQITELGFHDFPQSIQGITGIIHLLPHN